MKKFDKNQTSKAFELCMEDNLIGFVTHTNSPGWTVDLLVVEQQTEKAVKVRHEHYNRPVWIPKSAFQLLNADDDLKGSTFTLKPWFKKNLNNYQQKALGYLV